MKTARISARESKLRLGEFNREIGALWFRRRDWVGCTTATTEQPDITNYKDQVTNRGYGCASFDGGDVRDPWKHCSRRTR